MIHQALGIVFGPFINGAEAGDFVGDCLGHGLIKFAAQAVSGTDVEKARRRFGVNQTSQFELVARAFDVGGFNKRPFPLLKVENGGAVPQLINGAAKLRPDGGGQRLGRLFYRAGDSNQIRQHFRRQGTNFGNGRFNPRLHRLSIFRPYQRQNRVSIC